MTDRKNSTSIDPQRARTLMALYTVIQRSKTAMWISLVGGSWCLIAFFALGMPIGLGISTAVCGIAALLADVAHKRARRMWDRLCPCPGCEARRAREREQSK